MTPLERYFMLKEMTENFENKNMMRHHFISHVVEAEDDAYEKAAKLCVAGAISSDPEVRDICMALETAARQIRDFKNRKKDVQ